MWFSVAHKSDVASLRRRHRRCAQDIAARMSWTSILNAEDRTPDVSSRPKLARRSISRVHLVGGNGLLIEGWGTVRPHHSCSVSPGFLMHLLGAAVDSFSDPFLGSLFAFAQCAALLG